MGLSTTRLAPPRPLPEIVSVEFVATVAGKKPVAQMHAAGHRQSGRVSVTPA